MRMARTTERGVDMRWRLYLYVTCTRPEGSGPFATGALVWLSAPPPLRKERGGCVLRAWHAGVAWGLAHLEV